MIQKAETLYNDTDFRTLNRKAGTTWADYMAGCYETRDGKVKAMAKLYTFGLALRGLNPELGEHWMGVAQALSQEIIEEPEEFYDNVVRTLDNKND